MRTEKVHAISRQILMVLLGIMVSLTMILAVTPSAHAVTGAKRVEKKVEKVEKHSENNSLKTPAPRNGENHVPVLKKGVSATKSDQLAVDDTYYVTELQKNEIFVDPDGTPLDYTCYYYERSTDNGATWSQKTNFPPSAVGFTTICFTEHQTGTYIYRFYASDDKGKTFSTDTWTLTLNVVKEGTWNVTMNVGQDYNMGNAHFKIWKTAGIDEKGSDYVGWYEKSGKKVLVCNPEKYTIEESGGAWKISDDTGTYTLNDYKPVTFTDSLFGESGSGSVQSGTVQNNYTKYFAKLKNGR